MTHAEQGKPVMASDTLPTDHPMRMINGRKEDLIKEFDALTPSNHPGDVRRWLLLAHAIQRRGKLRLVQRGEPVGQSEPQGTPMS